MFFLAFLNRILKLHFYNLKSLIHHGCSAQVFQLRQVVNYEYKYKSNSELMQSTYFLSICAINMNLLTINPHNFSINPRQNRIFNPYMGTYNYIIWRRLETEYSISKIKPQHTLLWSRVWHKRGTEHWKFLFPRRHRIFKFQIKSKVETQRYWNL